jgi:maleylacetoacetate isomerase
LLQKSHGKYSFGDEVTLADVLLVPQVSSAIAVYKWNIEEYPTIKAVYENLLLVPGVREAFPDQ